MHSLRRGMSLLGYTQRSVSAFTRNCRILNLSVMKRRPMFVEQTCAPLISSALVSLLAVGVGLSTLLSPGRPG
jgi:hypothetical protein